MSAEQLTRRPKAASPGRPSSIAERRAAVEAAELELQAAVLDDAPSCADDPRFTAEARDLNTTFTLGMICESCPIRGACERYADAARPEAGFWAGRWHGRQDREALEHERARAAASRNRGELTNEVESAGGIARTTDTGREGMKS